MTMPDERTRALLWAGDLMIEIARDQSLPLKLRRSAVVIARHFPTFEDISMMARAMESSFGGSMLTQPNEVLAEIDLKHGPLRYGTRLRFPEE